MRSRKLTVCLFRTLVLCLVITGLALAAQPSRYKATAFVRPEWILTVDKAVGEYDPYFPQGQFEFVRSPVVLADAARRLRSKHDDSAEWEMLARLDDAEAVRFLNPRLKLDPVRSTSLFAISTIAPKPALASLMANAVAESYRVQASIRWQTNIVRLKETWHERLGELPGLKAAQQSMATLVKDLRVTRGEYACVRSRGSLSLGDARREEELAPLVKAEREFFGQLEPLKVSDYSFLWQFNDLALEAAIRSPKTPDPPIEVVEVVEAATPPTTALPATRLPGLVMFVSGLVLLGLSMALPRRAGALLHAVA